MTILIDLLVGAIALLHMYFLILEMFLWTTPRGLKVFGQTLQQAKASAKLAANQGLYNGFLSVGLIWGIVEPEAELAKAIKVFFLTCVVIAGLYGAWSVSRKILYVQALPAICVLVMVLL